MSDCFAFADNNFIGTKTKCRAFRLLISATKTIYTYLHETLSNHFRFQVAKTLSDSVARNKQEHIREAHYIAMVNFYLVERTD